MDAEKDRLRRMQDGLLHLRRGLAPFVAARMEAAHGAGWARQASRAAGGPTDAPADTYALLKTMIDHWHTIFEPAFPREARHRLRSFLTLALDGRNMVAHAAEAPAPDAALRCLDACHQLLLAVQAPPAELAALRALHAAELAAAAPAPATHAPARPVPRSAGTIEARLLDHIARHPDQDDDQIARQLGISPRQAVNQAARRLADRGLIRRFKGPLGKIVNRAEAPR